MKRFYSYEEELIEALKDQKEALAYLNEALTDEDPRIFLLALKDVVQAHGMLELAEQIDLSKKSDPKLTSIVSILNAVGMTLAVQPIKRG